MFCSWRYMGVFWVSVAMVAAIGWAQVRAIGPRTKSSAQQDREQIEQAIAATNKLLAETRASKQRSINELRVVERKIALHKRLISGLATEIAATRTQIEQQQALLLAMEQDLKTANERYAVAVRQAYIAQNQQLAWLTVLSAQTLKQAFFRWQYLRKMAAFRRNQVEVLSESRNYLAHSQAQLAERLQLQERLLAQGDSEQANLAEALRQKNSLYQVAQQQESQYLAALNQQQQALKNAIQTIENQTKGSKKTTEQAATNGSFMKAKGKLMWPAGDGVVVSHFGRQTDKYGNQHDLHSVRIRTPRSEHIRSVFAGEVSGVTTIPGRGYMVIVNHGGYRTSYTGLELVYVQRGEKVAAGQPLGVVQTDSRSGESLLEFMLYDEKTTFLDPEGWLLPQ